MSESIYIDGKWAASASGRKRKVINPATGECLQEIGYGSGEEALAAVDAAACSFGAWSRKPVYERADLLRKLADAIRSKQDPLARTLTAEVGKTLPESKGEIGAAADQFEWYAEEVKRAAGEVIPNRLPNRRHLTIRHPVGPVAAISPWNFPILLASRKMAPALAAGCTVVNRPASQAPLTMMAVFELIDSIGFPNGVANLVVGDAAECSRVFIEDNRIKKISFTGSLAVGKELYTQCASRMKKISLELGGHSPFVILPDVSVEEAAEQVVFSKYRHMGQVCISPSRFLIPNSKKAAFERQVVQRVSQLKIGNGMDPDTDVGPLFERRRVDACIRFVADIEEKGGKVLYGGRQPEGEAFRSGFFFTPTVVTDVTSDMRIMQEEPFSPIMPILGYDTIDQAIEMANDTPYGLAAYVVTNNLKWTVQMAEALEAGIIGINDCSPASAQCPFGGMKGSGVGREGWHQGLEAYYETKYVSIGI
ncbi:MAG: NAD-dependent succinate-semialdehyde dehydrogenase [Candidatus Latescibacterota bacterium]